MSPPEIDLTLGNSWLSFLNPSCIFHTTPGEKLVFSIMQTHQEALQAISAIVTIVSFPLIFLSIFIAFSQIKNQTEISRKEITFNGLIKFQENNQNISHYRQSIRERYENGDMTLNKRSIVSYYTMYWINTRHRFDFFMANLIPYDVFLSWVRHEYSFISGEHEFKYFERDGSVSSYNSRDHFKEMIEKLGIGGEFVSTKSYHEFYKNLYLLNSEANSNGVIPIDKRFDEISKYIDMFMRQHSIKKLNW